jgi:two-component system NarL family response regulator
VVLKSMRWCRWPLPRNNVGMIRVLVADDHAVVRAGLVAVLQTEPDIAVVAEARTGEEAVSLYRALRPDVVTMDLRMPGAGGSSAIAALCLEFSHARVLVLTTMRGEEPVFRALEAGAAGYLLKDADSENLIDAIRQIHLGRRVIPAEVKAILSGRQEGDSLSARELDVLLRVAKGKGNKEIGQELGISENTVKGYLKLIAMKLNAPDRTAAVTIALKRGFLHLEDVS